MQRLGKLGAAWGAIGVFTLLTFAVVRLAPKAIDAFRMGLDTTQWVAMIVFAVFMAYSEGYRGFQLKFSPRTAARVRYLRDQPSVLRSVLGPFFAMGYFHANRKTKIVAWSLTTFVVTLVILVQILEQPWRGIVDTGVVLGLTWGIISLAASVCTALTRENYPVSPEVD
jgi:hypothetical protein